MFRSLPIFILFVGALSIALTFGIRTTFGLFAQPMNDDLGWSIGGFAFAFAVQNLLWGALQPVAGAIADTRGPTLVALVGGVAYALGLWMMAEATTPLMFFLGDGVLIGIAMAASGMSVALGAITRAAPVERRGLYAGIITAGGSLGQLFFLPTTQYWIGEFGWQTTLYILAGCSLLIAFCAFGLPKGGKGKAAVPTPALPKQSIREALAIAFDNPSYLLLVAGFFVCGFHLAFIGFHLPIFATLCGLEPAAAADALALVGLFNAGGCIFVASLMNKAPSKYLLSAIYAMRSVVIAAFVLLPVTDVSIRVFGAVMGLLWLSTVAPTNGIIVKLFGTRYVTMLFGIVFFSHQVGGFLGAWLGGEIYEATGSYDLIWWIEIAMGFFAAAVHLPIRERLAPAPVPAQ